MIRCRNRSGTVIVTAAPLRHLRSEGTDDRLFRRYRNGDHDAAVLRGLGGTAGMALGFRRIPGLEQRLVLGIRHRRSEERRVGKGGGEGGEVVVVIWKV